MPKAIVVDGDLSNIFHIPVTASSNVTINGKKIALDGDLYGLAANGIASSIITINGKKILLQGDSITNGDTCGASSTTLVT